MLFQSRMENECWYHQFTHVMVNDPTSGYAISAERMLSLAG